MAVLFFTGVRFSELAGLKFKYVHLDRKTATICETLVYGDKEKPKSKKSNREIDLLPPVIDALTDERKRKHKKNDYVFLDMNGNPLNPD
ncbi:tyrosine-type recombinase/integrase [Thermodesulfobacteriota bacterium]